MRCKALISALALALLVAAAPAPAAGAESLPTLATQIPEDEMQVRPPVVSYTGDGTGYVGGRTTSPPGNLDRGGIHWLSWTQRSAFGKGWAWVNDCRPDCAGGSFSKHRAKVRATRPRQRHFTRLTIVFRYGGHLIHDHRVLERAGGYWYWGI